MDQLKMIVLGFLLLITSGCMNSGIGITHINNSVVINETCMNCTSLWEIDNSTGKLQPKNFDDNTTVRVFSLETVSANSVDIGEVGPDEFLVTLSADATFFPGINVTLEQGFVNKDFSIRGNTPGVQVLTNTNLNTTSPWATTITSAGDYEGNAVGALKRSPIHPEDPYLGMLINLDGDLEIGTNRDNNGSAMGDNEVNFIMYQEFNITPIGDSALNVTVENKSYVMGYNATDIWHYEDSSFNESIYLRDTFYIEETYDWSFFPGGRTSPPTPDTGEIALFARDDSRLYIKTDTGQIRRLISANTGSIILDEHVFHNNDTTFLGNVLFNHTEYQGVGNAYVCFDKDGYIFRSKDPCDSTADVHNDVNITDPDLGVEIDN